MNEGIAVTIRDMKQVVFPRVKRRVVEAEFSGGEVRSPGGILLVQGADCYLGQTEKIERELGDEKRV